MNVVFPGLVRGAVHSGQNNILFYTRVVGMGGFLDAGLSSGFQVSVLVDATDLSC